MENKTKKNGVRWMHVCLLKRMTFCILFFFVSCCDDHRYSSFICQILFAVLSFKNDNECLNDMYRPFFVSSCSDLSTLVNWQMFEQKEEAKNDKSYLVIVIYIRVSNVLINLCDILVVIHVCILTSRDYS
jgi:hypothetical protein